MALTVSPFGVYTDVVGVIDGTAAAEIVAMIVQLKKFLPSEPAAFAAGEGTPVGSASEQPMPSPEFDDISLHASLKLLGEIDALAAAIAAAPTS